MWFVHELRYKSRVVIGYRVECKGSKKSFDMPTTFLSYLFEKYFNYAIVKLGLPLECRLVNDIYVSDCEGYMNPIEIECESDIDKFIQESRVCLFDDIVQESKLLYRYFVCSKKLLDIGIPLGDVVRVNVNSKMHSYWGYCYKRTGYKSFDIDIAGRLMLSAKNDDGIDLVVMHELLHTCDGCQNHGPRWKYWAGVVCKYYGYHIKRLSDDSELGSDPMVLIEMGYKACQCVDCGQIIVKKTECDFIKYPHRWSCRCGGMFVRIS